MKNTIILIILCLLFNIIVTISLADLVIKLIWTAEQGYIVLVISTAQQVHRRLVEVQSNKSYTTLFDGFWRHETGCLWGDDCGTQKTKTFLSVNFACSTLDVSVTNQNSASCHFWREKCSKLYLVLPTATVVGVFLLYICDFPSRLVFWILTSVWLCLFQAWLPPSIQLRKHQSMGRKLWRRQRNSWVTSEHLQPTSCKGNGEKKIAQPETKVEKIQTFISKVVWIGKIMTVLSPPPSPPSPCPPPPSQSGPSWLHHSWPQLVTS